jgi:hypothetical protein
MKSADELVENNSADTNMIWESRMDYEFVQELLGHTISMKTWEEIRYTLDDVIFDTVMGFQHE